MKSFWILECLWWTFWDTQCDHLGNPILRAWAATWHLPTHFTWHKNQAFTVSPILVLYQLILRADNLGFVVEITHSAQIHWLKPGDLISRHHGRSSLLIRWIWGQQGGGWEILLGHLSSANGAVCWWQKAPFCGRTGSTQPIASSLYTNGWNLMQDLGFVCFFFGGDWIKICEMSYKSVLQRWLQRCVLCRELLTHEWHFFWHRTSFGNRLKFHITKVNPYDRYNWSYGAHPHERSHK